MSDFFVNLNQIFIIFSNLVNNDVVHMSHHFGCHENHFGRNLCVTINYPIMLLNGDTSLESHGLQHCMRNCDMYINIAMGNLTVII